MAYIKEVSCPCQGRGVGPHGDSCGRCEGSEVVEIWVREEGDCGTCGGTGSVVFNYNQIRACPEGCERPVQERPDSADAYWG
jgi:hypothetical protein